MIIIYFNAKHKDIKDLLKLIFREGISFLLCVLCQEFLKK